MTSEPSARANAGRSGETVRIAVSLLLFVHLFFVLVSLSANWGRSLLQARILTQFAVYTQLLNFDLNFTPYHLTHAGIEDVDHRLEVLPQGKDAKVDENWVALSDTGMRGGDRQGRYQRLAKVMAFYADRDDQVGRIAQSVAAHFEHQRQTLARVRCRRHTLQRWDQVRGGTPAERDPFSRAFFEEAYAADILVFSDGQISVKKVEQASQVAQPVRNSNEKQ